MSEIQVNKIVPESGTDVTLGDSGDTFTVPSGATIVNSGTATGFGGGKLLQVVSATYSTELTATPTSFTDTGLAGTITPSATDSKILIMAQTSVFLNSASYVRVGIERDISGGSATFLGDATYGLGVHLGGGATSAALLCTNYLDSPSTTSAITYSYQYLCSNECLAQKAGTMATIVLIEIGA